MESKLKIIAIIPARAGSKSIKDKNLIKLNKKTLIENCYLKASQLKIFQKIICTTNSRKIISLCKKKKILHIKRPSKFATSNSNVFYAVKHLLESEFKLHKINYDYFCLIQPVCIFLRKKDILSCISLIKKNPKLNSVQTIHKTPHNYHYLNTRIIKSGKVIFKFKSQRLKKYNKQLKEKTYNFGNLIFVKVSSFLENKFFFPEPCGYVIIDKVSSFDLDDKLDIDLAKSLHDLSMKLSNQK